MYSPNPIDQVINDLKHIRRIDRELVRQRNAERIAARFEAMNTAQARRARRHLHISAGLTLVALIAALVIFHDTPARTAAVVLEAEAQGGW